MKNRNCIGCHQLGQLSTRTIPACARRVQIGRGGLDPPRAVGAVRREHGEPAGGHLGGAPFKYFGDWTDRIAKGELPHAKPKRPQGVERNIVVTTWEWGDPKKYLHDLIASDRRYPTVNAYGPLYGSPEYSTDVMPILDPKTHKVTTFKLPVRDADTPEALGPGHAAQAKPMAPSPYWGDEKIWDTKANNHNAMFDKKGRVWMAATLRGMDNPAFCKKGSDHPSAKVFPLERSVRQVTMLDPKTMKYTFVDTCFGTHHLQFGYDANDTLWLSGDRPGRRLGQHQDVRRDRRRGEGAGLVAVRPRHQRQRQARRVRRARPAGRSGQGQAHRAGSGPYAVMPSPVDGSIWYTVGVFAGTPARLALRSRQPALSRSLQRAAARLTASAAATSTRTASSGRRWRAAISAASTAASARVRSTDRRRPAIIAPRAGRSTSIPARASRASARTAPSRAITPGSTSTTRSGSAKTSRCRPPTSTTAWSRSRTAR